MAPQFRHALETVDLPFGQPIARRTHRILVALVRRVNFAKLASGIGKLNIQLVFIFGLGLGVVWLVFELALVACLGRMMDAFAFILCFCLGLFSRDSFACFQSPASPPSSPPPPFSLPPLDVLAVVTTTFVIVEDHFAAPGESLTL